MDKDFLRRLFKFAERAFNYEGFGDYYGNDPHCDEDWTEDGIKSMGMTENEIIDRQFEIVDKPKGERQEFNVFEPDEIPDEFKYIDHIFVNQTTNGGYTGDDYAGDEYYPLPDGRYMKTAYQC